MCNQMHQYFDQIFSKYQCSFLEDYITQHSLLVMVEKRKEAIDKGRLGGALLTNLSKAFNSN